MQPIKRILIEWGLPFVVFTAFATGVALTKGLFIGLQVLSACYVCLLFGRIVMAQRLRHHLIWRIENGEVPLDRMAIWYLSRNIAFSTGYSWIVLILGGSALLISYTPFADWIQSWPFLDWASHRIQVLRGATARILIVACAGVAAFYGRLVWLEYVVLREDF